MSLICATLAGLLMPHSGNRPLPGQGRFGKRNLGATARRRVQQAQQAALVRFPGPLALPTPSSQITPARLVGPVAGLIRWGLVVVAVQAVLRLTVALAARLLLQAVVGVVGVARPMRAVALPHLPVVRAELVQQARVEPVVAHRVLLAIPEPVALAVVAAQGRPHHQPAVLEGPEPMSRAMSTPRLVAAVAAVLLADKRRQEPQRQMLELAAESMAAAAAGRPLRKPLAVP